ncbi:glycosyltransferase family 2 protein [Desulfuromonas acetexigens]|uniref:Glycosyltransferase family 2 protein n=1 Tax=Trichloromonas acetexigens TaxID=38815 RepID=A0A550JJG7_9BACT|nr:glycosyltransferase family A protein [Desulfuromonas acetexigens]TRO83359.1 glycosyltransferase family 2 protein [Desulfuromonas acetexigens]
MPDLISVIIPTFNREKTISRAIESVYSQEYKNIELIIVDDFSKDNTFTIVTDLQKKFQNLKYLVNQRSKGACGARNTGILNSNGKYVAFLDSDDEWLPSHLSLRHAILSKKDVNVVFGDFYIVDDASKKNIGVFFENKRTLRELPSIRENDVVYIESSIAIPLIQENFFHLGTIMLPRSLAAENLFREDIVYAEDRDFGIRLSLSHGIKFAYITVVTYCLYKHGDSLTTDNYENDIKKWNDLILLFDGYRKSNQFNSSENRKIAKELKKIHHTVAICKRKYGMYSDALMYCLDSLNYGICFNDFIEFSKSFICLIFKRDHRN